MTAIVAKRRPSTAARRFGYSIVVAIDVALLYLINVHPGWAAVPVLTDETVHVLPVVNASLIAGVAVALVEAGRDPPWLVALGGMITTGLGTVTVIRMWQVFPLDFGHGSLDWPLLARVLLAVAVIGSVAGFAAQAAALVGALAGPAIHTPRPPGPGGRKPDEGEDDEDDDERSANPGSATGGGG
jgi:hypothetical protein